MYDTFDRKMGMTAAKSIKFSGVQVKSKLCDLQRKAAVYLSDHALEVLLVIRT